MRSRRKMGIASKRGQMKYVRLLLWGMYEEMAHSFFKVGQCPLGHNWSTYFATYHCTLVFPKYINKIISKTLIHLKHCQRHNDPKTLSTFTQNNTSCSKQKLQQALKSWSPWLLFCSKMVLFSSGINNMVLFCSSINNMVWFCSNVNSMAVKTDNSW